MRDITVGQMLNMTSGIPDFDTAKGHGVMSDSLRAELYKNPGKIYTPTELMSVPWVAHKYRPCRDHGPYWHKCYSSTNFMLLGLLLANGTTWNKFDQSQFLPASLKDRLKFAVSGAPSDYTAVHGYDRTSYNMPEGNFISICYPQPRGPNHFPSAYAPIYIMPWTQARRTTKTCPQSTECSPGGRRAILSAHLQTWLR